MLTFNFDPFEELQTDRLLLRQLTNADAPQVFKLRSNPEAMKYVPRPLVTNIDEAIAHIELINSRIKQNEGINWAITLKGTSDAIGIIGHYKLEPENHRSEIGYMVLPEYSGQGITSEAVAALVDYGFNTMKLHSMVGVIDPRNVASARVLEKNRFKKEGHFRQHEIYNGEFLDSVYFARLKSD